MAAERPRVEDRLTRAVGAARHHRVGSVAQEGHPAEGPPLQRVLVDHRILKDGLGGAHHRGHVQPVETPVLERPDEVLQTAPQGPVPLFAAGVLISATQLRSWVPSARFLMG
ncbi:hypothetical protein ACFQX6_33240 [Streptosporangium lutulentum]